MPNEKIPEAVVDQIIQAIVERAGGDWRRSFKNEATLIIVMLKSLEHTDAP